MSRKSKKSIATSAEAFAFAAEQIGAAADALAIPTFLKRSRKPKAPKVEPTNPAPMPVDVAPIEVIEPTVEQVAEAVIEAHPEAAQAVEEAKADTRRSIVPRKYKVRYAAHQSTCGDDMALELKAETTLPTGKLNWEALKAIAEANGLDVEKYASLNPGQKRMNIGNRLRGKLDRGEDVTIGTRRFAAEDWTPRH